MIYVIRRQFREIPRLWLDALLYRAMASTLHAIVAFDRARRQV